MSRSVFTTKSVEAMHHDARASKLKRTLTALDLMMLGVGVVVGAGIFVVTGRAAAINAGPAVTLSFVIAGLAATLAGLCYSEMAAMLPASGGTYSYTSASLGELLAFLIGWDLILEYLLGAAMVSVSWSGYVTAFFRGALGVTLPAVWTEAPVRWDDAEGAFAFTGSWVNLPALLFTLSVTALLIKGIRESSRVNIIVVVAKLMAIVLFVGFGCMAIDTSNWHPFLPENTGTFGSFGPSGVLRGASMVFFAYVGFDAISTAAQEAKNPGRDLPRGILGSLTICTGLYVIVALVLTGVVSYRELAVPHPIAVGIEAIGYRWLTTVVDLGAIAGLSSGAIVMLMGQPRIFLAMAQDGLFPPIATRVHKTYGTPHITTIWTGAICAIFAGLAPVEVLSELVSLGTLLAFFLVSISVSVLRIRRPELHRPFKVPFGPFVVPGLSASVCLLLIASMPITTLTRVGVWMLIGLVFYVLYGRKHSTFGRTLNQPSS